MSIGEKKAFGGAAPRYKRLEDYRRCRGVTVGIGAKVARGSAGYSVELLNGRD